ncbi:MAG TPA: response regulator [Bacillota bacterium]|nr:response regulator [Bacillota bacterium]
MHEKTIMLVEDNSDDIILLKRAFKKCCIGSKIVVARDGVEAIEYLFGKCEDSHRYKAVLPDVVLLDIKMPRMDGLETLKQIRSHSRTAYLPVVILTSSDEERDKLRSYKLGANSYIRKPVDFDKFIDIMGHLGLYWLRLNELPKQLGEN